MPIYHVVVRRSGPEYVPERPLEEQTDWLVHAGYMDQLVADGFVILGGPLADGERVALAYEAESEAAVRRLLAEDPWNETHLRVETVEEWTIRLRGPGR